MARYGNPPEWADTYESQQDYYDDYERTLDEMEDERRDAQE